MRLPSRPSLPLLAVALLSLSPFAAFGDDLRPLFEMHDRHSLGIGPANVAYVDQDLFVARDGTAIVHSVNRGLAGDDPFATTIANGPVPEAQFAALNAALAAARPSQFSGVCAAGLFPLGSSYHFTLSWFGVSTRKSVLTVTDDGSATAFCSPEVRALIQAAFELQRALLLAPGTALQAPTCTVQAQCPAGLLCCYPCGIPGCANRCTRPTAAGSCPFFP